MSVTMKKPSSAETNAISCRVHFVWSDSPYGDVPPQTWSFGKSPPKAEVEVDRLQFVLLRRAGGHELAKHVRRGHVRVIAGDRDHAPEVVAALADGVYPLRDRKAFAAFAGKWPVE